MRRTQCHDYGWKPHRRTYRTICPRLYAGEIVDNDLNRCNRLTELLDDKTMIINGDGRDMDLLIEEGLKNTEAFVALTGNSETNILACLAAKRMGVRKTVAEVENIDYIAWLKASTSARLSTRR